MQLLGALFPAPDVEIVKAALPETSGPPCDTPQCELLRDSASADSAAQTARNALLEHLQRERRIAFLGLAHQQMDVLGHHHIADHRKLMAPADFVEDDEKDIARPRRSQKRHPAVTAESNEVEVTGAVAPFEIFGHVETETKSKTNPKPNQTKIPTLLETKKDGAPSKATTEIQSQPQTHAQSRTRDLQSELAKWYHPPVGPVNCGDYGDATERVGHPAYPKQWIDLNCASVYLHASAKQCLHSYMSPNQIFSVSAPTSENWGR
jgi:hypothetical protein